MKRWCICLLVMALMPKGATALECPEMPRQVSQEWELAVQAQTARIGNVAGPALQTRARRAAADLLSKLPDADRVYLEQMMFASYCSAVRDNPQLTEAAREARVKAYAVMLRDAFDASRGRAGVTEDARDAARKDLERIPLEYSVPVFHEQVRQGKTAVVELFLKAGIDPNAADRQGYTALMFAAGWGRADIARLLLRAKADPNIERGEHGTALNSAARNGSSDVLKILLERKPKPEVIDQAFIDAAQYAQLDAMNMLAPLVSDQRRQVSRALVAVSGFQSSGVESQEARALPVVRRLIDMGADVNASDGIPSSLWTPLTHAASEGNIEIMRMLLANHAEVDHPCGCNASMNDVKGATPLLIAAWERNDRSDAIVAMLLAAGASPQVRNADGTTVLMLAIANGTDPVVVRLLDKGADIHARDKTGDTALFYAVREFKDDAMRELIRRGAKINERGQYGYTALEWAAARGCAPCAKELLAAGADVNMRDDAKRTPLMEAVRAQRNDIVRALLLGGARVEFEDEDGKTAWSLAEEISDETKRTAMLTMLKRSGARP